MHWKYRIRREMVFVRHMLVESYKQRFLVSFVAMVVVGTTIELLNNIYYDKGWWQGFEFDPDMEHWFCEFTDLKRAVRQPMNTFTNFIYLIFGIYFMSKGLGDIRKKRSFNLITANHFYSFVIAVISFYVFACSSFFHASLIEIASDLDFSAVYSITLFPLMYMTHRFLLVIRGKRTDVKHWNERLLLIVIFTLLYIILTFIVPLSYVHTIVPTIILIIFLLGFYLEKKDPGHTNKLYLLMTVITIVIAVIMFEFDIKKIWCYPHSLINPHSLWHLFNGTSLMFFYMYIRSERYDREKDNLRSRIRQLVNELL